MTKFIKNLVLVASFVVSIDHVNATAAAAGNGLSIRTLVDLQKSNRYWIPGLSKAVDDEMEEIFATQIRSSGQLDRPQSGEFLLLRLVGSQKFYYAWTADGVWRLNEVLEWRSTHDIPFAKTKIQSHPMIDAMTAAPDDREPSLATRVDVIRLNESPQVLKGYRDDLERSQNEVITLNPEGIFEHYENEHPDQIEIFRNQRNYRHEEYHRSVRSSAQTTAVISTAGFSLSHALLIYPRVANGWTLTGHVAADVVALGFASSWAAEKIAGRTGWLARRPFWLRRMIVASAVLGGAGCAALLRYATAP